MNTIQLSPSGRYIGSGQKTHMGFPADVIIWDFVERKEKHRLSLHKGSVQDIHFSADEKYVITLGGQDDNAIVVWDMETGEPICGSPAFKDTAHFVRFFNNNEFRFISGGNYHLRVWEFDLANRKLRPTDVKMGTKRRISSVCDIDECDGYAYVGTTSGDVLQVSLGNVIVVTSSFPSKALSQGVTCLKMLPSGDLMIGSGTGKMIRATISGNTMKAGARSEVLGAISSFTVTNDGTHMFIGTQQSNTYWADTMSLTCELKNTCHNEGVSAVAFCQGCSKVFGTAAGSEIRLWNTEKRHELVRIVVQNQTCLSFDFSQDGSLIYSG